MTNQQANDIARLLIASSGLRFDGFAFLETGLSEKDIQKVISSINGICNYEVERVERKNGLRDINLTSTKNIVKSILHEKA